MKAGVVSWVHSPASCSVLDNGERIWLPHLLRKIVGSKPLSRCLALSLCHIVLFPSCALIPRSLA